MSVDPNSGIAEIVMYQSAAGALSAGAQFSGVLIAPDEILTVAHGVTAPDGSIRGSGAAFFGPNGAAQGGGVPIASVHVVDGSHPSSGVDLPSQIETDYAVIHLSQPVTSAQVFALGTGSAGTYTAAGYPVANGSALTGTTESFTAADAPGVLQGASLTAGGNDEGASGGPVYAMAGGTPTIVGLITAAAGPGIDEIDGLTSSTIDQIRAWVYADDAGTPWGAAFAPPSAAQPAPAAPAPAAPVDGLGQLSSMVGQAATAATGARRAVETDVANALTAAQNQGQSYGDLPDAACVAADVIRAGSYVPKRAVAFLGGLMAAASGVGRGQIAGYALNVFGIRTAGQSTAALNGYDMAESLGVDLSAPLGAPAGPRPWNPHGVADALRRPAPVAASGPTPFPMVGQHLATALVRPVA